MPLPSREELVKLVDSAIHGASMKFDDDIDRMEVADAAYAVCSVVILENTRTGSPKKQKRAFDILEGAFERLKGNRSVWFVDEYEARRIAASLYLRAVAIVDIDLELEEEEEEEEEEEKEKGEEGV